MVATISTAAASCAYYKSVASRACWKLLGKVQSVESRACWKNAKQQNVIMPPIPAKPLPPTADSTYHEYFLLVENAHHHTYGFARVSICMHVSFFFLSFFRLSFLCKSVTEIVTVTCMTQCFGDWIGELRSFPSWMGWIRISQTTSIARVRLSFNICIWAVLNIYVGWWLYSLH